jgi:drug/metabolite transporter (DMT)-like permease
MTSHAAALAVDERQRFGASRQRAAVAIVGFVALWFVIEMVAAGVFRHMTAWQVVFIRYTLHLAIVLAIWGRKAPWRTRRLRYQLARSSLMLVMPGAYVLGTSHVAGDWINTIFWSAPVMVLVFAALLDEERASLTTWAAAALGGGAAWLYFAPSGFPSLATVAFGLAMSGSFALYIPMTRRLRDEPLRTNLFYTAVVPWTGLLPVMPRVWATPALPEVLGLLFIGGAGWIGLLLLDRAAEAAPVSHTAPLLHLQIGLAIMFTFVARAYPGPRRFAAVAVLLAATVALSWPALRREPVEVAA